MTEGEKRTTLSLRNYDGPRKKGAGMVLVYVYLIGFLGIPTTLGLYVFAEWFWRTVRWDVSSAFAAFLISVAAAVVVVVLILRAVRRISYPSFTGYVNDGYGWDWSDVPDEKPLDGEYSVCWRRGDERGFGVMVVSGGSLNVRRKNGDLLDVHDHMPSRRSERDRGTVMYVRMLVGILILLVCSAVVSFLAGSRFFPKDLAVAVLITMVFVGVPVKYLFFDFDDGSTNDDRDVRGGSSGRALGPWGRRV